MKRTRSTAARAMVAAAVAVLALAACGFHLRGEATYTFATIYVNAPGAPVLAIELKRALNATGSAKVVDDPKNAQVTLDIPLVADDKEVLSISGAGAVEEYALRIGVSMIPFIASWVSATVTVSILSSSPEPKYFRSSCF